MVNAEVNNGKNNKINSMEDSFVRSLLNKEPKKEEPNDETENKSEVQPVRYKGGETAEDVKGNTITRPASGSDKFLGSLEWLHFYFATHYSKFIRKVELEIEK